ncbi:MAG: alpha/beta hydrolase [Bacilli bacterium]|nr:alpha/beta hydrolase [Bacilli bacterium]
MAFYNNLKFDDSKWVPLKGRIHDKYKQVSLDMISYARKIPHNEDIYIKGKDGCKLHAALYLSETPSDIYAIECHGYKDPAVKDFSGGLPHALKCGQNVLLIDHRGHGESAGKTICFGIKEQYDVLEWVRYLNDRFNSPKILLYGISMGAATVLLCSAHNLPENVLGIIADCPYSSAKDITVITAGKMGVPPRLAAPALWLGARIYGRFDLNKGEVSDAVKNATKPILLIHGTEDDFVPFWMSEKIYESNKKMISFLPVDGAPHGLSWMVDNKKYLEALDTFFNNIGLNS